MKISFETFEHPSGVEEIAIITHEDGSYTTMPKSIWEAGEAAKENGTIS